MQKTVDEDIGWIFVLLYSLVPSRYGNAKQLRLLNKAFDLEVNRHDRIVGPICRQGIHTQIDDFISLHMRLDAMIINFEAFEANQSIPDSVQWLRVQQEPSVPDGSKKNLLLWSEDHEPRPSRRFADHWNLLQRSAKKLRILHLDYTQIEVLEVCDEAAIFYNQSDRGLRIHSELEILILGRLSVGHQLHRIVSLPDRLLELYMGCSPDMRFNIDLLPHGLRRFECHDIETAPDAPSAFFSTNNFAGLSTSKLKVLKVRNMTREMFEKLPGQLETLCMSYNYLDITAAWPPHLKQLGLCGSREAPYKKISNLPSTLLDACFERIHVHNLPLSLRSLQIHMPLLPETWRWSDTSRLQSLVLLNVGAATVDLSLNTRLTDLQLTVSSNSLFKLPFCLKRLVLRECDNLNLDVVCACSQLQTLRISSCSFVAVAQLDEGRTALSLSSSIRLFELESRSSILIDLNQIRHYFQHAPTLVGYSAGDYVRLQDLCSLELGPTRVEPSFVYTRYMILERKGILTRDEIIVLLDEAIQNESSDFVCPIDASKVPTNIKKEMLTPELPRSPLTPVTVELIG